MRVAIIPARGGSRRIPRKNIRNFHGIPIIAYSIEVALNSGLFGLVAVSTEDDEIANVAREHGAGVIMRDPALARDEVGTQQVMRGDLKILERSGISPDFACCIYPCAPLIKASDLKDAYRLAYEQPYNYVYAVGQFYFAVAARFIHEPDNFSHSVRMESLRYIDINTEEDWRRAEEMYAALHKEAA